MAKRVFPVPVRLRAAIPDRLIRNPPKLASKATFAARKAARAARVGAQRRVAATAPANHLSGGYAYQRKAVARSIRQRASARRIHAIRTQAPGFPYNQAVYQAPRRAIRGPGLARRFANALQGASQSVAARAQAVRRAARFAGNRTRFAVRGAAASNTINVGARLAAVHGAKVLGGAGLAGLAAYGGYRAYRAYKSRRAAPVHLAGGGSALAA
jgi:hypothetical protein